jgi:hypothetical protein
MIQEENKVPSDAPSKDTPKQEQVPDIGKKISEMTGGKYKNEDDLVTAYKDLEKKLGEQGEEVRQSREFAAVVQPLLDAVREDPALFKILDEKLRSKETPSTPNADTKNNNTTQDEVRGTLIDTTIAQFESKYGINKLSADERKTLREKIANEVFEITGKTINEVDLRRLGNVLDKAFVLANKDNLVDKSKLDALISAQEGSEGEIPSLSSSPSKKDEALAPEEAKTAEKLGLTREQYLEGKKVPAKN